MASGKIKSKGWLGGYGWSLRDPQTQELESISSLPYIPDAEAYLPCLVVKLKKGDSQLVVEDTAVVIFSQSSLAAFDSSGWLYRQEAVENEVARLIPKVAEEKVIARYGNDYLNLHEGSGLTGEQQEWFRLLNDDPLVFFNILWKRLFALRRNEMAINDFLLGLGIAGLNVLVRSEFRNHILVSKLPMSRVAEKYKDEMSMAVDDGSITLEISPVLLPVKGESESVNRIVKASESSSSSGRLMIKLVVLEEEEERKLAVSAWVEKREGESYVPDRQIDADHFQEAGILVRLITALRKSSLVSLGNRPAKKGPTAGERGKKHPRGETKHGGGRRRPKAGEGSRHGQYRGYKGH